MSDDAHILPEPALANVVLPPLTLYALRREGVPALLRLPQWPGPTLFSSELGEKRIVSTAEPDALVSRLGDHEGYIIGSVRDTMGEPKLHSVFVLRREVGDVFLLDVADASQDRFVNSSLETFVSAMEAFFMGFPHMTGDPVVAKKTLATFRSLLEQLDAPALADPEHYWPGWLEALALDLDDPDD